MKIKIEIQEIQKSILLEIQSFHELIHNEKEFEIQIIIGKEIETKRRSYASMNAVTNMKKDWKEKEEIERERERRS